MRRLFPAILAVALSFGGCAGATPPIVVELFTSEGCSSCPPADEHLFELRRRDGILALGWHVDYWDWLGWRDRFADPEFSARQRVYARRLGTPVYTPQLVVSGTHQAIGSAKWEVDAAIRQARSTGRRGVVISASWRDEDLLEISLGEGLADNPFLVQVVRFADEAKTEVEAGENAGRTLRHANIVETWQTVGTWDGSPAVIIVPAAPTSNHAILVQMPGQGAIIGALEVPAP
ncbi:MAG: DUF1223 domain-containing protein [bacterium]|nr:DUF1223 domain-containing protein [bacterium]